MLIFLGQNKTLEQQLSTIKGESQRVLETAIKEKEKSQKLEVELKEVRLNENVSIYSIKRLML